jgi:ATP-dependent DNA ligase
MKVSQSDRQRSKTLPVKKMSTKAYQIEPARCKKSLNFEQCEELNKQGKHDEFFAEIKYDGLRYLWQIRPNGAKHNYLTSRRISVVTNEYVEKQDSMPHLRDFKGLPADTIFDGEIVGDGISSDTQHEMAHGGKLLYKIWDLLMLNGIDLRELPQEERKNGLYKLFEDYDFPDNVCVVQTYTADKALSRAKAEGLEGIVIKDANAKYGKGWIKVKQENHADVIIWGYEDTNSADWAKKGWIGALKLGQFIEFPIQRTPAAELTLGTVPVPGKFYRRGKKYYRFADMGRASGFDNAKREEFSKRKDFFLGTIIEVEFQQRFEKTGAFRSPRFNRFRGDKNPWDCVYVPKN